MSIREELEHSKDRILSAAQEEAVRLAACADFQTEEATREAAEALAEGLQAADHGLIDRLARVAGIDLDTGEQDGHR